MAKFIVGILIGLLIGGVLTFYLFVGVPRAADTPGSPVLPPDPNGPPAGTGQIVLRQEFFNEVLRTIFTELSPPAFPLSQGIEGCDGRLTVLPEGSGVRSEISFENNRISAPLAFSGSYASPFGCLRFTGWAKANFGLRYDAASQTVFGQINVETVNLDGVNPLVGAIVTPVVQSTLNTRVNPIRIIEGRQLAVDLPVAAANGNLQAAIQDVRAEVKDNALRIDIIYDFAGASAAQQPQQTP